MRQAPDHRVTRNALAPATSTPPILTSNTARQHCMVCLNALARHFQAQVIQARERAQVRAIKDSIGHVEVFQMDGVGTPIIGRPRPIPGHDTPNPANNTPTPSNAKSLKAANRTASTPYQDAPNLEFDRRLNHRSRSKIGTQTSMERPASKLSLLTRTTCIESIHRSSSTEGSRTSTIHLLNPCRLPDSRIFRCTKSTVSPTR